MAMQENQKTVRRRWRGVAATAATAALTLALAACGSSSSGSSGGGGGGGSTTVTVGIPTDDASYAPLYLAEDKGLFKKYGITVKPVAFSGGADLAKAVAGGSVDIAVSALSELLLATEQHQPMKAFYGGYNQTTFDWFGQKGTTNVAQGKGKKWAVTKIGSSTDFLTRYLFSQNGIDPVNGASVIGVGGSAAQVAALKAKQVDATSASTLTAYQLQDAGYPVIAKQSDFAKEFPNHVAYAKTSFLKDDRQTAINFLRGMVDGFNLAKSDPKAAQQAIVDHMKTTPAYAARAYKDIAYGWDADGRLPGASDMDVFWKIGVLNKQWPKAIPQSQWLDTSFIDSYGQWSKTGSSAR
jgi:NitT/TauT family transport system substrate-binding protein